MKQQLRTVLGLFTFVFGLLLICIMLQHALSSSREFWWFVARPPIPPGALFVRTEYPRDYASDGVYRSTRFQSSQSVAEVRQFYRTELAKRGWTYRGPVRPECGGRLQWPYGVVDVYDHGRTLQVAVTQHVPGGTGEVSLAEWNRAATHPVQRTPVPNAEPHAGLIGDWRATDEGSGREVMICFYEEGKVALVSPRGDGLAGEYRWDSDGMIRMTFNSWTTIFSNTPRAARAPCARVPSFLSGVCRVRFVTPDAYPAPGHVITAPTARKRSDAAPYPAPESHSDPAAYPVPVPLGTEFRHIDEVFAVVIDGADLTLTPPSGTAQTFQRVPAD